MTFLLTNKLAGDYLSSVLHFFLIDHLLNRIKRISIITKFFGSSLLGELWFIDYWNNFFSQKVGRDF
ncbi:hypothetical protein BpHYR1_000790 [Brachionus plicatilis]|uniref:Uncharacterized protein n=1 Tax=Brachionus plicatilis TaxID=10195 RepID=A0A3M7SVV7_BRAPC|nr:hypothetical protein BpHYR1_000790 [Brachionus plicatilis]